MTKGITTGNGTPLSRFAFGAMQWGGGSTDADAEATFNASRAAGINHFDTAHVYNAGASEKILGGFAKDEADALFIATKVNYDAGNSRSVILKSFDESRQRLGLDQVDLLYLHRWDENVPLRESFETLAELQSKGVARYLGVSNFAAWQVMKAQAVAGEFGTRIDFLQPMYNLVKRQAEVEILPMCADQGIEVASYSPLAGGLLTGKYTGGQADGRFATSEMYTRRYDVDWMRAAAAGLVEIARETGTPAATLAIAWLARHAPTVRPILSARTVKQLSDSISGMNFVLDDDIYARITALSPTPAPATDRLEEA